MMSSTTNALLSPSDIADLAKVNRPVVSNWRKRHTDFPSAVAGSDAKPLFSYDAVVAWLRQRGHEVEVASAGGLIWSALNAIRGQVSIEDAADFFLLLASLKRADQANFDEIANEYHKGRATGLIDAVDELRQIHGLEGIREPSQSILQLQLQPSTSPVFDAVNQIGVDELADAVDFVLERLARSQIKRGAEFGFIASRTSALIASLIEQKVGTVYDPACGIANILIKVFDRGVAKRLVGSDINLYALSVAKQRAFLRGASIEFVAGNVLDVDPDPDLRADVVVAEPPFNTSWDPSSKLMDPRFTFGVPPKSASDLAWIQHVIAHLLPNGRAYVLTAPAALFRSGSAERKIRANLLSAGCVEAVVGLPSKMLPQTSINLALWVLRPQGEATDVLFVDASDVDEVESKVAALLSQNDTQSIDSVTPHTFIPIAELLSAGADLTPTRWIERVEVGEDAIASSFTNSVETVQQTIHQIGNTSLAFEQLSELPEPRITTIRELIDNGIVELKLGRSDKARKLDETSEGRIARAMDVKNRRLPPINELADFTHPDLTLEGDVLVTTMNEVRAIVDETGGHLPSTGVERLRVIDRSIVSPSYLAAVITGSWNARFQTGATIQRARIRDLEIPLIPTSDQRKVDVAQLAVCRLREQSELLNIQVREVQTAILDALRYNVTLESPKSDNGHNSHNSRNNRGSHT